MKRCSALFISVRILFQSFSYSIEFWNCDSINWSCAGKLAPKKRRISKYAWVRLMRMGNAYATGMPFQILQFAMRGKARQAPAQLVTMVNGRPPHGPWDDYGARWWQYENKLKFNWPLKINWFLGRIEIYRVGLKFVGWDWNLSGGIEIVEFCRVRLKFRVQQRIKVSGCGRKRSVSPEYPD